VRDAPFWFVLTLIWLLAFLAGILAVSQLNQLWLICFLDVALTVIMLAIVGFLRSLAPDAYDSNAEILIVFIMIGALALITSFCVIALNFVGGQL
jgi:hypothetical protein